MAPKPGTSTAGPTNAAANVAPSSQASTNYKEAFSLFDKRGTGRVPTDTLGDLLRACGQNPTLAEITELEKGVGKECEFRPFRLCAWVALTWWQLTLTPFREC
jgi:Ca2+-binding EF-hand superfamily protein